LLFSLLMWIRFTRTRRTAEHTWAFEKKVYCSFGLLSIVVGLFFALVCVANASNTFDPVPGFGYLAISSTTTDHSVVGHALNEWITSGNSDIPPVIQQKVQERLAWQGPKAIVCGISLVGGVALSLLLWNAFLKTRRVNGSTWTLQARTFFGGGIVAVAFSFLLLLMVLGNMQAALAPSGSRSWAWVVAYECDLIDVSSAKNSPGRMADSENSASSGRDVTKGCHPLLCAAMIGGATGAGTTSSGGMYIRLDDTRRARAMNLA
ncbi:MAG TPA: hypothetical protein VGP82_04445, partial [Ktedonobacterales bacterium]|nr:hypothetical protein [Ktedonobacterales bacterium]